MPARLFLLVGPPAVGKLTIARELARLDDVIVVDNHLVNNPVFVPVGLNRGGGPGLADTDALRARVTDVVLEATVAAPADLSHVFTIWLPDEPGCRAHVERLRGIAERRGARFVPVWLTASSESLLARVAAPERGQRSKLTDPDALRELLEIPRLPAPPDALALDTTDLDPAGAAALILGG
ncbi:hypothetical protein DEO23_09975 [Brachybacterium endophyticum]|uniref:Uncharacterized protein n=1 Tax=Brachybacterium endophyticum TaxID=2182385 RepID=A0A2U2RK34_9MICO|nr:AAA family ATPase [Brachybacterium endophyticum]PWH06239.1 hypothetical protein DEO23_09975 [Brachybacterium endophyticum]